ncbi:MAG: tyrosine-type recombinase/integrase [Armatimonadetes bacterium]|nr:tyrosine-type recombinase/integrase [Armatimonadota bacterium]
MLLMLQEYCQQPDCPDTATQARTLPLRDSGGAFSVVCSPWKHTFAPRLAMAGRDLYEIKELMGHASIKMTERYAHLCPSKLREAVNCLPSWNGNRFNKPTATTAATGSIG